MKLTKHIHKRSQQRGICFDTLLLVVMFGEEMQNENQCVKFTMTEKARGKIAQLLDKCRNKTIVADEYISNLITAYTFTK